MMNKQEIQNKIENIKLELKLLEEQLNGSKFEIGDNVRVLPSIKDGWTLKELCESYSTPSGKMNDKDWLSFAYSVVLYHNDKDIKFWGKVTGYGYSFRDIRVKFTFINGFEHEKLIEAIHLELMKNEP